MFTIFLSQVDNQIDQAEKEARAALEKVERLKREKIQGARSVFEKAKANKLNAAKAAKNNLSQSSVAGQQIKKPRMTKVVTTLKRSKGRICLFVYPFRAINLLFLVNFSLKSSDSASEKITTVE